MIRLSQPRSLHKSLARALVRPITGATSTDPDVAAYAESRGLSGASLQQLNGFVQDLKRETDILLLYMGRSEFLGRDGSTHHAVIGGDATISGTVGNNTTGIGMTTEAGTFVFPNPRQSADVENLGQYLVGKPTAGFGAGDRWRCLWFNQNASPNRAGDFYFTNNDPDLTVSESVNGTSAPLGREHYLGGPLLDEFQLYGEHLRPDGSNVNMAPIAGLNSDVGRDISNVWRNYATSNMGSRSSFSPGTQRWGLFGGDISLFLITDEPVDLLTLNNLLNKWDVAGMAPPTTSFLVGDSMTLGLSGADGAVSRSMQLFNLQSSDWKGSAWQNIAVGGEGITSQEGYYQTALNSIALTPDMPGHHVWFWGGYNVEVGFDWSDSSDREALADRYVAMAVDAASRGIKTVHWSVLTPGDGTATDIGYRDSFNDYYRDEIAAISGDHIFYDHRLTYTADQFDGTGRTGTYFSDNVHLTELGQETLVADFISRFSGPL